MFVLALLLPACGGDGADDVTMEPGGQPTMTGQDGTGGMNGTGGMGGMGGMLGGTAETTSLARVTLEQLPQGPLAWSAFTVADVDHSHAPAFVQAREATTVTIDGETQKLSAGEAVFVPGGTSHQHGSGAAWDVLLAQPDVEPPPGVSGDAVFRSEQLEGLPEGRAGLATLLVEMPPDTETSVHQHPGPEFIYVTEGPFIYESAPTGELETEQGDHHTLPASTPVQKRNPRGNETAAFLSWFVVQPDEPFATEASFDN